MNRNGMDREMATNTNRKVVSKFTKLTSKFTAKIASTVFAMLAVVLLLATGARPAFGQACSQNWTGGANVWAAEGSVKVMLNNAPTTNVPTIPITLTGGTAICRASRRGLFRRRVLGSKALKVGDYGRRIPGFCKGCPGGD